MPVNLYFYNKRTIESSVTYHHYVNKMERVPRLNLTSHFYFTYLKIDIFRVRRDPMRRRAYLQAVKRITENGISTVLLQKKQIHFTTSSNKKI